MVSTRLLNQESLRNAVVYESSGFCSREGSVIVEYEASFAQVEDFSIGKVEDAFTEAVDSGTFADFEVDPHSIRFEGSFEYTYPDESLRS